MSVREYVGARYVPIVVGEWDNTRTYEPLMVVTHQGNSYTSRQYVPTGIEITNESYWVLSANYNAQVEEYRKEVLALTNRVAKNETDISNLETGLQDETTNRFNADNNLSARIDAALKSDLTLARFGANVNEDATQAVINMMQAVGFVKLDADYQITKVSFENAPIIIIGNNHKFTYGDGSGIMFEGSTKAGQGNNGLVYIENCKFDGLMGAPNSSVKGLMAVSANRCDNVIVKGCEFKNFAEDGFFISGCLKVVVEDCTFDNIGTWNYQTTRNGFSTFSWYLTTNGEKLGTADGTIRIANNTFTNITDEGFRIDDFDVNVIEGNRFCNIGMYAMEPTFDVSFSERDKVFIARGNKIDTTGSTAISFDFLRQYDQKTRKMLVHIEDNEIVNVGKSDRYRRNDAPLATKNRMCVNLYIPTGYNELHFIGNHVFIDDYMPLGEGKFYNYLMYVSNCDMLHIHGNHIEFGNDSTAVNASNACIAAPVKGNVIFTDNVISVAKKIWTLLKAENLASFIANGNTMNIATCEYSFYVNNCDLVRIIDNAIVITTANQHAILFSTAKRANVSNNIVSLKNHSSSHIILSILQSVTNTFLIFTNNITGITNNLLYPTEGYQGLTNTGNI